jgi:exosortase A-associated hydrolase 2
MTPIAPGRQSTADPRYLDVRGRRLFSLRIVPTGSCRGTLLYLPPFGEEMNRTRSHVAATARALAAVGWRCVLLDPYGTGDSEGDMSDADFDAWITDALEVARQLISEHGQPLTIWGTRTGALLAAETANSLPAEVISQLVFWQPVIDGAVFVNQYLRLRLASQAVHGSERETTETMRERLASGDLLEVAGFMLSGPLVDSLSRRSLGAHPRLAHCKVNWIEAVAKPDTPPPPRTQKLVDELRGHGANVHLETVVCPPVWQIHGREEAPALQEATVRLLTAEEA